MENNRFNHPPQLELRLVVKEKEQSVRPDSSVEFHIGAINTGEMEDVVRLSVKGVPEEWVSFDEDELRVAPGKAKQAVLSVHPPAFPDGRVGKYTLEIQGMSRNAEQQRAKIQCTVIVAAQESKGRIGVFVGEMNFSVAPGSNVSVPLLLENNGVAEDAFNFSIVGIPKTWVSTQKSVIRLRADESQEMVFTLNIPRSPEANVGRTRFKIQVASEEVPSQKAEIDCILIIGAFSEFTGKLRPVQLNANQPAQLLIDNEGNVGDTYELNFQDSSGELVFEKITRFMRAGSEPSNSEVDFAYSEIVAAERLRVSSGTKGVFEYRSRLRSRPIIGGERVYPFSVKALSSEKKSVDFSGQIKEKAFFPPWLVALLVIVPLFLCLIFFGSNFLAQENTNATQTASFEQTQVAVIGAEDTDADGLLTSEELEIGTDPLNPDTDFDGLSDGEEVRTHQTSPLFADTENDGLSDGDEILVYKTNPLIPDTDEDLLNDGDEINRQTNPLMADTDADGMNDGAEVALGTDPLKQDTDNDELLDGQENQTCPHPLKPDTDADGIIDGKDIDPCDAKNPSLTATVLAVPTIQSTSTPVLLTPTPSETPIPPTSTAAPVSPILNGLMVFETDRDGGAEIYILNAFDQAVTRMTSNATTDIQPALAPDAFQIAYVTDQDGNNEIYLTGVDRRTPINLTNNPADDQQPTWSPDGKWIAFTSNRDGNQEIYVMRSDGSEIHNLTNDLADDFSPSWVSVSGFFAAQDWIVFTSTRDGNQEIYKIKPDGSDLTNLTQHAANDYSPAGYIKGDLIAFVSDRDGNAEIYTMEIDGTLQKNITNHPGQDFEPTFKPDGSWIAFSTDRDGDFEIYVIQNNGLGAFNMTRNPGQDKYPVWK